MDLGKIFKAYDIRGVYPDEIDEEAAERIGGAFAEFCGAPKIFVARDMRLSSGPLSQSFMQGVIRRGVDVADLGMVSTDALYFAAGRYNLPGAIFTASHNPAQYNGIKMCRAGAAPVGQETGLADILRLAEHHVRSSTAGGKIVSQDILDEFVDHLLGFVEVEALRPLKVVVDAANGMAGKMVPALFDRLPFELVPLFFELDGTFPNHPADPIQIENLTSLISTLNDGKADIGMAFDGDADRVFLVDEQGEPVSGSLTAALVAARVLAKEPGAHVVYSLVCSRVVPETILEGGGKPVRSRVGHSFVKKVMADWGAVFGGEHSGHYYFRDNFRADSGLICALFVLDALSRENKTMTEIMQRYRRYWNSGEINSIVHDQEAMLKTVASLHPEAEVDWTDGLTIDYPDWWFNLRGSNTEPLLRLNVEAKDRAFGEEKTQEILEVIQS